MEIKRDIYLNRLINRRHNGMVKVITGVRRCGKSYLLFNLFSDYLRGQGIDDEHIISVDLDSYGNRTLRNPDALYSYVESRIKDRGMYYILLDEVQLVADFEEILNGFLHMRNADVYVTGSNARFLSKDVITEFRGRGDEVKMYPLNFREYMSAFDGSYAKGLDEYMLFGGLPQILLQETEEQKMSFLSSLFAETYIRDIKERYSIRQDAEMEELINIVASSIGALTNPRKLADTFLSVKKVKITPDTIKTYLDHLCDSFLIEKSKRYDVKGKRYIDTPYKYYFIDMGLRNVRLNFSQTEPTHIMENVIYNELRVRGFNVDVGVVSATTRKEDGSLRKSQLEIDFVCNIGSKRYYVQSAYRIGSEEKSAQEQASLLNVRDSFKKIIISGEDMHIRRNEAGITTMSIYDFLLKENSLEL